MSGMYLLATILCLALGNTLGAVILEGNYNVTAACTTVKTGTQLGSIQSCDYYYVCTSSGPVKTSCSSGYSYNYQTQSCNPSAQVSCLFGQSNPCNGNSGNSWVANINNCQGWYYCEGTKLNGSGTCNNNEKFESSSQSCVYGKCNVDNTGNTIDMCNVVPPNLYFGTTDNCKTWNWCSPTGVLSTGTCDSSAFLIQQQQCGYDTNGACDRVVSAPVPTACTSTGQTAPDNTTCGNYYYCNSDLAYVSKSCQANYYYDTVSQGCVLRQNAVAAEGCNRCQYATSSFVNAVDYQNCATYYYCNNGVNGETSSCKSGYYFNEGLQGCAGDAGLEKYASTNGACRYATVAATTVATTGTGGTGGTTNPDDTTNPDNTTNPDDTTTPEETTTVDPNA